MRKKFAELKARMSPEARTRAERRRYATDLTREHKGDEEGGP